MLTRRIGGAWPHRGLVAWGWLWVLVGCGAAPHEPAASPEEPEPSAQDVELAEARCDYVERCDPDAMHAFAASSRASCIEFFACVHAATDGGNSLEFDRDACMDSLRTRACLDPGADPFTGLALLAFPWGAVCGVPSLEERRTLPLDAPAGGEPCLTTFNEDPECRGESYCAVSAEEPSVGAHYCGICEPRVALEEPCDDTTPCVLRARCVQGLCAEPLGPGEPCSSDDQCASWMCDGGRCVPPEPFRVPYDEVLDAPCDGDYPDCGNQPSLKCRDGRCAARADEGEPCMGRGFCRVGQECIDGRCVALGCTIDVGEPCLDFCLGECIDGTCRPRTTPIQVLPQPRRDGSSCDFDFECTSGFCDRQFTSDCTRYSCTVVACDGCGTCAPAPTPESCGP